MAEDKQNKGISLKVFDDMVNHLEGEFPKMMDDAIQSGKKLGDLQMPAGNPIQAITSAYEKWRLNGALKDLEQNGSEITSKTIENMKAVKSALHLSDIDKDGSVTKEELQSTKEEFNKYKELTGSKGDLKEVMAELSEKGIDSFDKLKEENKALENKAELDRRFDKMDGLVRGKSDQAEFDKFVDRDKDGKYSNSEVSSALKTMDEKGLDTLKELKDYNAQNASVADSAQSAGRAQNNSKEADMSR